MHTDSTRNIECNFLFCHSTVQVKKRYLAGSERVYAGVVRNVGGYADQLYAEQRAPTGGRLYVR